MRSRLIVILIQLAAAAPALAAPVLRWSPAGPPVALGQAVTLSVMLDEAVTVRTIELFIDYDPTTVVSVSGAPGQLFQGYNVFQGFAETAPQAPGQWHGYCVILGAADWTTGPGELFRWTVRGRADGGCPVTTAEVTLLPPGGGNYVGTTLPATTLYVGDVVAGTAVDAAAPLAITVAPNPFNPRTRVWFTLGGVPGGRLEVLDARGGRVATLWSGAGVPDWVAWDGRDQAGRAVASGVYTFLLVGADGRATTSRGTLVR